MNLLKHADALQAESAWDRFVRGSLAHFLARTMICLFFMDCCLEKYKNWEFHQSDFMQRRIAEYPFRYKDPGMHHPSPILSPHVHPMFNAIMHSLHPKSQIWLATLSDEWHDCWYFFRILTGACAGFPYFALLFILPCAVLTIFGVSTRLTASVLVLDMLRESAGIIYAGL